MKYGLSKSVLEKILKVLRSFPAVEEAVIYGSRAKDKYREGSDIDLTLKGDLSFQELLNIEMELDKKYCPIPSIYLCIVLLRTRICSFTLTGLENFVY